MTTRSPAVDIDEAWQSYGDCLDVVEQVCPGAIVRRQTAGVVAAVSNIPIATLNGLMVLDGADPAIVADRAHWFAEIAADRALPWSISVLEHRAFADLVTIARQHGLSSDERSLWMTSRVPPRAHRNDDRAAPLVRVADIADTVIVRDMLARGFGAPHDLLAPFASSDFLTHPAVSVYLGETAGRLAGTAAIIRGGCRAFVVNVTVLPEERRRGVGLALVRRALSELVGSEVRQACLMCEPSLQPLYEQAGFVVGGHVRSMQAPTSHPGEANSG